MDSRFEMPTGDIMFNRLQKYDEFTIEGDCLSLYKKLDYRLGIKVSNGEIIEMVPELEVIKCKINDGGVGFSIDEY